MGLVCLESNKKLLAYSLFTKYIPHSSGNYIEYLIHNTSDLAEYRAPPPIVNLPTMTAKKHEKPKKGAKQAQEVPTSIKPPGRGPARPMPVQA